MPHSLRKRYGHATPAVNMSAQDFANALLSHLKLDGRHIRIRADKSWGPRHEDEVYVNFVNLPQEVHARGEGGGAESENNRASYWIRGFGVDGAPAPSGKVRVEEHNSVFRHRGGVDAYGAPRGVSHQLRAKSAAPSVIAKYLADFLNKLVAEVPPKFTHTGEEWYARALGNKTGR
jgi:hypothetical protein